MGFFNWVMHGLGFETDDKKKGKTATVTEEEKYSTFNLHEKSGASSVSNQESSFGSGFTNFGMPQADSNTIIIAPRDKKQIQEVIDYLKQGQTVNVNLSGIADADRQRIMDFLSGAIYGINGSIHRWEGDLFILTPEGHKILRPEDKDKD
ncbi:MAG: cell division protein SepF [Clostridia bacterium]|nr:cell division protein SepF [Clostridia bacterium]